MDQSKNAHMLVCLMMGLCLGFCVSGTIMLDDVHGRIFLGGSSLLTAFWLYHLHI